MQKVICYISANQEGDNANDKFYHVTLDSSLSHFSSQILSDGYVAFDDKSVIVTPDRQIAANTADLIKNDDFRDLINDAESRELLKYSVVMQQVMKLLADESMKSLVQNDLAKLKDFSAKIAQANTESGTKLYCEVMEK